MNRKKVLKLIKKKKKIHFYRQRSPFYSKIQLPSWLK